MTTSRLIKHLCMVQQIGDGPGPKPGTKKYIRLVVLLLLAALYFAAQDDFIIWKDGRPQLAPWRKAKLEKELEELENAEQYVLIAGKPDYYPCYNCYGKNYLWLNAGEVWKYGVTRKGEKNRYKTGKPSPNLLYLTEYEGAIGKCLALEKIKIYYYATLPENLKRKKPLMRPPGNKRDD